MRAAIHMALVVAMVVTSPLVTEITTYAAAPDTHHDRRWTPGPVLDQGTTGTCGGQAFAALLEAEPTPLIALSPYTIYEGARRLDGLPDTQPGTTVQAVLTYLQRTGRLSSWRNTRSWIEAKDFLVTVGPIVLSTAWYRGMSYPGPDGYAIPEGDYRFEHAYMCYEWTESGPYGQSFTCQQSWGPGAEATIEGSGGRFRLHARDVATLLAGGGYATLATKAGV